MTFSLLSFLQEEDTRANVPWTIKHFEPENTIVEENSIGKDLFLIIKGEVHIINSLSVTDEITEKRKIAKLSDGETFGELALFDDDTRSATVMAATGCEIAVIDGSKLISYMNDNPEKGYPVLRFFFKQIAHRMRECNIRANTILGFYLRENA
ncbi:MAG: cyclic nucleotide-binding domain-containing protein [Gammaproteobacteria bacterium]